jgi:hypothetical protein
MPGPSAQRLMSASFRTTLRRGARGPRATGRGGSSSQHDISKMAFGESSFGGLVCMRALCQAGVREP